MNTHEIRLMFEKEVLVNFRLLSDNSEEDSHSYWLQSQKTSTDSFQISPYVVFKVNEKCSLLKN